MGRGSVLAALFALALGGCLPDLSAWQIVSAGVDAGRPPGSDGGAPQPNPIDLGASCPNPHLVATTSTGTGATGRVVRLDPATGSRCRESALLEQQLAYGYAIRDVEWHAETGEVLGLADAVVGLDAEGFPRWRYQEFGYSSFEGSWLAAFGTGASVRIAVAWNERSSSSVDAMLLLNAQGIRTSGDITPPFFGSMIAAHPDGSSRLLIPSRANADIDVYSVGDATTTISESSAIPLWSGGTDLPSSHGNREHIATDLARGRLVITHARGIAFWAVGEAGPSTAIDCPSFCGTFHAAAPDPNADDSAYAICNASGASTRHLVRVASTGCTLVIDGTSFAGHYLEDVALARAPL